MNSYLRGIFVPIGGFRHYVVCKEMQNIFVKECKHDKDEVPKTSSQALTPNIVLADLCCTNFCFVRLFLIFSMNSGAARTNQLATQRNHQYKTEEAEKFLHRQHSELSRFRGGKSNVDEAYRRGHTQNNFIGKSFGSF